MLTIVFKSSLDNFALPECRENLPMRNDRHLSWLSRIACKDCDYFGLVLAWTLKKRKAAFRISIGTNRKNKKMNPG